MTQDHIITNSLTMTSRLFKGMTEYVLVFLRRSFFALVIVGGILLINSYLSAPRLVHSDAGLSPPELITKYGYPAESHSIQTEDGYILTAHRIPYGRRGEKTNSTRPVVLLVHGLIGSSAEWVMLGPKKSLGFLLADAGYDVWLANTRGNTWSRKHATIDVDRNPKEFFDFSFHELAIYDLPGMIDFIQTVTRQKKITYIGFSQGTTALFAMASEKPTYIDSIRLMVALAPVGRVTHFSSIFANLGVKCNFLFEPLSKVLFEIFPRSEYTKKPIINFCNSALKATCTTLLFALYGFDYSQLDQELLPVIYTALPAGSASKQPIHFLQMANSGRFQRFDHGATENLRKYGQETPPTYDLKKNTARTILYHGSNDGFATTTDVEKLEEELPNVIGRKLVSYPQFTHGDFLWATDIYELLNKHIVEDVKAFGEADLTSAI